MSCVLRIGGVDLDIDRLLTTVTMKPRRVFRKGSPRDPSNPQWRLRLISGANFDVSDGDFSNLNEQVNDALLFLNENKEQLLRFREFPGVEGMTLDFALELNPEFYTNSFKFPTELLVSAGSLDISLELTIYPTSSKESE